MSTGHPLLSKLSRRTLNRLRAAGITEPQKLTVGELVRIPGIGVKSVEEIARVIYYTYASHQWE